MRPIYTPVATPSTTSTARAVTRLPSPATCRRRRVWACGSFSGDGTPQPGSSDAALLLHPSDGPPRALLIHLFAHFASAALRQSSSPRFGSFFFFISSSTAVIRHPIRALFNPNMIQSPVKWIWKLKILFLLLLSLDLLLSHQKN